MINIIGEREREQEREKERESKRERERGSEREIERERGDIFFTFHISFAISRILDKMAVVKRRVVGLHIAWVTYFRYFLPQMVMYFK